MEGGSLWKQLEGNLALALDRTRILVDGWILRINESLILNDPRDLLPSIKLRLTSCLFHYSIIIIIIIKYFRTISLIINLY